MTTPLLTRKAIVLAKLETTYNIDSIPSAATDGILVEAPEFVADPTILERNFTRNDLSMLAHTVGRKLAKLSFTTELRGNGKQNSGVISDVPVIARLFQACGFALSGHSAPFPSVVFEVGDEATIVAWATGGTLTNTDLVCYYITVDTLGPSGTAKVTVTSDTAGEGSVSAIITTAAPITLGTHGLTVTPVFTGSLAAGQRWCVWLMPASSVLDPVSDIFSSLTLYAYYDGTLHACTGALGTFTIDATGGQFAKIKWEFTGQYVPMVDAALVNPVFERTLPPQVQLARLNIDNFPAVVNAVTFAMGNVIQPRPDVNGSDGYNGVRLTSRKPTGGIDPEATLVASHDFWGRLAGAARMPFQMRVGNVVGNTVWMLAPCVQYDKMTYKDRVGLRVFDAGLAFSRVNGNDEVRFVFA
jgi:hypothetical protein